MKYLISLLAVCLGLEAAAPKTTTLVSAITTDDLQLSLASVSGLAAGDQLYIDREAMRIYAISGNLLAVSRGAGPTGVTAHAAGATVLTGPARLFQRSPFFGSCNSASDVDTLLDITMGTQYTCTSNAWVASGGSGGGGGAVASVNGTIGTVTINGASIAAQDMTVARTSSTVLTIPAAPAGLFRQGTTICGAISSATATITSGTGTALIAVNKSCAYVVRHDIAVTCSGCTASSGSATAQTGDLVLYTWTATSGTWDTSGGTRKLTSYAAPGIVAGSGITEDCSAGYCSWSAVAPANTVISKLCGVGLSTSSTSPTALATVTFGSGLTAGDMVRITTFWTHSGGTTNQPRYRLTLGGVTLDENDDVNWASVSDAAAAIDVVLHVLSTSSQRVQGWYSRFAGPPYKGLTHSTLAVNVSGSTDLVINGWFASGTGETVSLDHYCVERIPAQ
jgi:hypothetical protein